MRLCLAFMCLNELDWLKLHLSVWKRYPVEGIIAVDGGSTDGTLSYLTQEITAVYHRAWDWKPLDQENHVIERAERDGYTHILLTAPDELLFPDDVLQIRDSLRMYTAVSFPTYNFIKDRLHYASHPPYYPDIHIRAWRLGQGIRHVGAIDSAPNIPWGLTHYMPDVHLFHYSGIKDRRYYGWKGVNFHRVKDGLPPLTTPWQEHEPAPLPPYRDFTLAQPLNPYEVGISAPCR